MILQHQGDGASPERDRATPTQDVFSSWRQLLVCATDFIMIGVFGSATATDTTLGLGRALLGFNEATM